MQARDWRILLVEDNEDNRLIYTAYLEHVGCRVIVESDGPTALTKARDEQPDLVLMDISLPGIDGLEATRRLKTDPVTRTIPVIALTAHAMPEDQLRASQAGCDGYLAKPIEPRDVVAEVTRMLEERAA